MKNISQIDWARLAAYIDGEGCIGITKECKRKGAASHWNNHYALRITVTNTDPRLPLWCKNIFGGFIAEMSQQPGHKQNWKSRFNWIVSNDRAAWVLRSCLSHFVIKREQAEIGLAFRETFSDRPKKLGVPVEVMGKRESMFLRMKEIRHELPSMDSLKN